LAPIICSGFFARERTAERWSVFSAQKQIKRKRQKYPGTQKTIE